MTYTRDIKEFQEEVLQSMQQPHACLLHYSEMHHNILCLHEEITELTKAYDNNDIVGVADALADLVYFAMGFAWKMRIPFDQVWAIVHKANMRKKRGLTHRGMLTDAAKPEGWVGPEEEIKELLK